MRHVGKHREEGSSMSTTRTPPVDKAFDAAREAYEKAVAEGVSPIVAFQIATEVYTAAKKRRVTK